MGRYRLLSEKEVFENKLNIFDHYSREAYLTDFALLHGGINVDSSNNTIINGYWWLSDVHNGSDKVSCVGKDGNLTASTRSIPIVGVRPAIDYSLIRPYIEGDREIAPGLKEVFFGEYPTNVVNKELSDDLEQCYQSSNGCLTILNQSYSGGNGERGNKFIANKYQVYGYNGGKYIRVVPNKTNYYTSLHDGSAVEKDRSYWVKVEPISWLVDEDNYVAVSEYILFAGVPFGNEYTKDYDSSILKTFIDGRFAHEVDRYIIQNNPVRKERGKVMEKSYKNSYGFDTSKVTEEDIIKGSIESDVAVFLHGRSSDGKSARVKELDPDCEIIYMRNATPDSLNGKSVYDASTGKMIDVPPTWYTKVVDKCNKESDKIHIVFFDELTNALPSMQGMAFNIILDHEVNGKWKLPKNARIAAAGNDLSDSLAANKMAEPLFNRFAHVYINTEVEDWLKWAKAPKKEYQRLDYTNFKPERKIHPAVISYIRYKSTSGQDVLRTPFTGDKPNADPRKWEMASKVLYKTNKPEMLRSLIGEPLTKDFVEFVRRNVITVEDVINHNYDEEIFDMDISEKFTTAVGLSSVDEEHFEEVRNFVSSLGPEVRTTFETMWAGSDESRLETVAEARLSDKTKRLK